MSIIEVMVAMSLLASSALVAVAVLDSAGRGGVSAQRRTTASLIATREVEAIKSAPYSVIGLNPAASGYTGAFESRPTVAIGSGAGFTPRGSDLNAGTTYSIERYITWRPVTAAGNTTVQGYKDIAVIVRWTEGAASHFVREDSAVNQMSASSCTSPSVDTAPGSGITGVVNTYYSGTGSVMAGSSIVSVGTPRGASTSIAPGDLLLVMQMQDAIINSTDTDAYGDGVAGAIASGATSLGTSGRYEYVMATSVATSGSLSIFGSGTGGGLLNTYWNDLGGQPRRSFQVIRVPTYADGTKLAAGLTAAAWDGTSGGVLAVDVAGTFNLSSGSATVDGLGFRGAGAMSGAGNSAFANLATSGSAIKGEGIAGTPRITHTTNGSDVVYASSDRYVGGDAGRGAPANAGGAAGTSQGGGGGGAGGGAGGAGGVVSGGVAFGGSGVTAAVDRLVLGGGGGAGGGQGTGNVGQGGGGGGLVMIRASALSGAATITARGVTVPPLALADGVGGGGGGGTVFIASAGAMGTVTAIATGGVGTAPGGASTGAGVAGGGGGGGSVLATGSVTATVTGGAGGTGVFSGAAGSIGNVATSASMASIPGHGVGVGCIPVVSVTKTTSTPTVVNGSGGIGVFTIVASAPAGRPTATNVVINDPLPSGFTYSSSGLNVVLAGGASRGTVTNPTTGTAQPSWGSFTIPPGGSVSITYTVLVAASASASVVSSSAYATFTTGVATGSAVSWYFGTSGSVENVIVTPFACATPSTDVAPKSGITGIVNRYYVPAVGTVAAGATRISYSASTGTGAVKAGDLLLIMQMQDAPISSSNTDAYGDGVSGAPFHGSTDDRRAGHYEYAMALSSDAGGVISLAGSGVGGGLLDSYEQTAQTTSPRKSFQVIRVPTYSDGTSIDVGLTAAPWDGNSGGVLAFDVAGTLNLNGQSFGADGTGYRGAGDIAAGGKTDAYAAAVGTTSGALKGEGIAGVPEAVADATATSNVVISAKDLYPGGDAGFGAPGNAGGGGGGGQGGGGGAGMGDGGTAGSTATAASGGAGVTQGVTRLVPGGGGGAGGQNGGAGIGFGGHGGGIVMLRAVSLAGSGTASANGTAGVTFSGPVKMSAGSDGIGGGGGGGAVLVSAPGGLGGLTATAIGGSPPNSGYSDVQSGGGGGGLVLLSGPATTDVSGGGAAQPTLKSADGATGSASTDLDPTQIPGTTLGVGCRAVVTVDKTTSTPSVLRVTGTTAAYTITVANLAGRPAAAGVTVSDTLANGVTLSATTNVALTGGATRTSTSNPSAGSNTPSWGTFTIPGGATVTITFTAALPTTMTVGSTVQNSASATDGATVAVQYTSTQSTAEDVTAAAAVINLPLVSVQDGTHPGGATDTGAAVLAAGGTLTGVVNSYWPGVGTAARGATSITLGTLNAAGASTAIAAGDLLMVMQMQDASIDTSDTATYGSGVTSGAGSGFTDGGETGVYEYVTALAAPVTSGGSTTVAVAGVGPSGGLLNTYTSAASTATRGQRTFQIVRVPQYSSATVGAGLTAAAWNGSSGGVLAVDVSGALTLGSQTVNLTGLGFRGGGNTQVGGGSITTGYVATGAAGIKGEGIAGSPRYVATASGYSDQGASVGYPNGDYRRGAPGNAGGGGNSHNAGGGGGGNGGVGGIGGVEWMSSAAAGGLGGAAFPAHAARVVLGGGGGAGDANNRSGPNHQGGAGGGIAFIRAGSLSGTGTITADGGPGTPTAPSLNDGGGGGGAGGSVVVTAGSGTAGLTVTARGGRGGAMYTNRLDGAGGGGGVVLTSGALAAATVTGGQPGMIDTGSVNTSTAGANGVSSTITPSSIPGIALGRRADATISGVVNTYFAGSGIAAAGSRSITVGASSGASTAIATGDMVLIMQMQAALIDSSNTSSYGSGVSSGGGSGMLGAEFSGRYEYAIATSAVSTSGGTLTVASGGMGGGLINSYSTGAPSSITPRYAFQVIRVPRYASATMGALDATAWNGSVGGVLAVDVPGTLALAGATVNLNAKGFRGGGRVVDGSGSAGTYVRNDEIDGQKGEGIAGTPRHVSDGVTSSDLGASWVGYPGGDNAMAAPANAGGGGTEHNAGGGGGANGGQGGNGGDGWTYTGNGGRGGAAVPASVDRLYLGGGGGSGDANNACVTDGGPGGGLVLMRAGALSGTGTISSNGATANIGGCNDGGGGGGAGGTVVVLAGSGSSGLTIQANGGAGAAPASGHGAGGGGGGGVVLTSGTTASTSVSGGSAGVGSDAAHTGADGSAGTTSTSAATASVPGATLDAMVTARPSFGVPNGLSTFMPTQSAFANGNRIDVDLVPQFPTSPVALPGLANVGVKLQLTPSGVASTTCVYVDLVRISTGASVASGGALGTSSAPVCTSNGAALDTNLSAGTANLSGVDLNDLRLRVYARDSAGAGINVAAAYVTLDWQGRTGWVLSAGKIILNFLGTTAVLLDGGAYVSGDSAYTSTVVAPARTAPDRSVLLTFSGRTPPGATVAQASFNFGWDAPIGVCWWGELLSTTAGVTTTVRNLYSAAVPFCSTDPGGVFHSLGLTTSFLAVPDLQVRLHFSSADGTSVVSIDKAYLSATWTST